jgi:hypothetical protein
VIPALQFEWASIQHGPEFGMPQAVIDGHRETLEGGAESARMILRAGGRLGMGGDYGFAWNPHGTYAKESTFFVRYVGLTPRGRRPAPLPGRAPRCPQRRARSAPRGRPFPAWRAGVHRTPLRALEEPPDRVP